MSEPRHCEDYINDPGTPLCLAYFLLVNRLPAIDSNIIKCVKGEPVLYADWGRKRVRVIMASRLGDVGITEDLGRDVGYSKRVSLEKLSNFSDKS